MGEHKHGNGAAKASADKVTSTPLDCYRAIACTKAICDTQTGLLTYMEVQEGLALPKDVFGKRIPMQGHFALAGSGEYEIRVVWHSEDGGKQHQPAGDSHDTIKIDGRQRFCAAVLTLPPAPGVWSMGLDWRHVGELTWRSSLARCPIVFSLSAAPQTQAPSARA